MPYLQTLDSIVLSTIAPAAQSTDLSLIHI